MFLCFKPLSFGEVCFAAIANWYSYIHSKYTLFHRHCSKLISSNIGKNILLDIGEKSMISAVPKPSINWICKWSFHCLVKHNLDFVTARVKFYIIEIFLTCILLFKRKRNWNQESIWCSWQHRRSLKIDFTFQVVVLKCQGQLLKRGFLKVKVTF